MSRSVSKMSVAFGGTLGLLCASSAYAASSAEVAVATNVSATSSVSRIESNAVPTMIIAANQRKTNLQKTAAFVIVSDIGSDKRRRSPR